MSKRWMSPVLAAVLAVVTAGCGSAPKSGAVAETSPEMIQSETLTKPLGGILADAVIAQEQAGKKLPEDFKTPEFVPSVIDSLRLQYPQVFAVTAGTEKDFAAGRFDDKANTDKLGKTLDGVDQNKTRLSLVNSYLAEQFRAGKLMGVRLELATRLVQAQVDAAAPAAAPAPAPVAAPAPAPAPAPVAK